ncbi:glutamate-5-semialdehyde dehydrogenase [Fictibacillus terranigra]|uniref:Gamma-glutamyl phosphate reductase n=1 Tax=Fictibacillus terranigra TaxID=3058424 RepID=A0ABT8E5G2_9BACL|nr:glutamate-5-semialdehyde dehydrogenase [Fictibacillus sp. CENA-BCM004]MDN4073114.1 glutamate-5-semialdehyde dehydrogenase [Fictibacillus sp. CENA-BCM004]
MSELITKAKKAKRAVTDLITKSISQKNQALQFIADQLIQDTPYILQENKRDIEHAQAAGLHDSLVDRLILNEQRIKDMAEALEQLTFLPDPTGNVLETLKRPNGLMIEKVTVPLGVIGMIYEARPNVTVDASSLCLKTGNAVLLRGSSSAIHSNKALVSVIHKALEKSDLPTDSVQLIEDTSRDTAAQLFKLNEYLDVLIPRGGKALIQAVVEHASVPVLETGAGNCHVFIDESADPQMAIDIVLNAKTQRPSVCNSIETVLVEEAWAKEHIKELVEILIERGVELRVDQNIHELFPSLFLATEEDWQTEYLNYILAIKTVRGTTEAIEHINQYGSKHSEAIITESEENVRSFFQLVDAAALYHNASTRFTDGFEFGFGAEIGISTQKLHARGPMGLPALSSSKYIIKGKGQIRE